METEGRIFVVAVVVIGGNPQTVSAYCEALEQVSGKGKFKWGKAEKKRRLDYLRRVFDTPNLHGRLCYAVFRETKDYENSTIDAIARAVRQIAPVDEYTTTTYIDALSKSKRHIYGALLRKSGIATHKVQGVTKDENNPLVRLADAVAGSSETP